MATTIVTKNGSGVPLDTDLVQGELAIDLENKRIYSKDPNDEIVQLGSDIDIPDGVEDDDMLLWSNTDDKWTTSEYVPSTEFSTSPPVNPKTGMLWQDTTPDEQALYCWDGSAWFEIVGANGHDGGDAKQIWSEVTDDGDIYYNKGNVTVTGGFVASKSGAGLDTLAIGSNAGLTNQQDYAVAVGRRAGEADQQAYATAVGTRAGFDSQGAGSVSVGAYSGETAQGPYATAVGYEAGKTSQGESSTAVGQYAGLENQGIASTALGVSAGQTTQGNSAVAVGSSAGKTSQGDYAVAFGPYSGQTNQSTKAASFGWESAVTGQGESAVAVGPQAGRTSQGQYATAVGQGAGKTDQGDYSTAVGVNAGETNQGEASIAIGWAAGQTNQAANGIIINSAGTANNSSQQHHISICSGTGKYLEYNGSNTWTFAGGTVTGGGLRFDNIVQDGAPVVDSLQIIRAFMKLRDAVEDTDSSVEELREKLKVAVVDIIDQFQEQIDNMDDIDTPVVMPAEDSE